MAFLMRRGYGKRIKRKMIGICVSKVDKTLLFISICKVLTDVILRSEFNLTLYVPRITFQCVAKPTRCNTSYE